MKRLLAFTILVLFLGACAPLQGSTATPGVKSTPSTTAKLRQVTVAMGYIPDVQFAPYFVAQKRGYFADEGLQVQFDWGLEVDGVKLVGLNQIEFANVGADQIIQARAQGIPIVYVANWYNAFPIEVVSLKEKEIVKPEQLIGKKVGLPCLCGASYTAWRALLSKTGIDPAGVNVQNIGYTQVAALSQGTVDAVVVYANNEPVQLKLLGKQINEIRIWEFAQLVGNGIATSEERIKSDPELVTRFTRAFLRGLSDTISNPEEALKTSTEAVPEAGGKNLDSSRAVLLASIALWKNPNPGASRAEDWKSMEQFMRAADFIHDDVDVTKAFTNDLLPN